MIFLRQQYSCCPLDVSVETDRIKSKAIREKSKFLYYTCQRPNAGVYTNIMKTKQNRNDFEYNCIGFLF